MRFEERGKEGGRGTERGAKGERREKRELTHTVHHYRKREEEERLRERIKSCWREWRKRKPNRRNGSKKNNKE